MNASSSIDPCLCPLCGQVNGCAMAASPAQVSEPCWCTRVHFSTELLHKLPDAARGKACICQACVQQAAPP